MTITNQYKIHPIVMGTKAFDKGMMTYQSHYGQPYTIPIYCWYLEGGDKKIIVDTGELAPLKSKERETSIGGQIYTFEEGLSRWGLKPEDIDIVIHTHLHNDHCENDYKCTNAKFYIHEKELERIHNQHPLDFRYMEDCILDIEKNGQIIKVMADQEILPGIEVIHTPAHTEGGLTLVVNTSEGKAMITGFCTIMENFHPSLKTDPTSVAQPRAPWLSGHRGTNFGITSAGHPAKLARRPVFQFFGRADATEMHAHT